MPHETSHHRIRPDRLMRARDLRQNMTRSETILWQHLRRKQLDGIKFRRQHPVGPFVVDFACLERRLAIEIDGDAHDGRANRDNRREEYLRAQGMTVLRFNDSDIVRNLDVVLSEIARVARGDAPSRRE